MFNLLLSTKHWQKKFCQFTKILSTNIVSLLYKYKFFGTNKVNINKNHIIDNLEVLFYITNRTTCISLYQKQRLKCFYVIKSILE